MGTTVCELTWIFNLLQDLNITIPTPIPFLCDNRAALRIVANPVFHERTKHLEIDCHLIRDKYKNGFIAPSHVPSKAQLADVFTKSLLVVALGASGDGASRGLEGGLCTSRPATITPLRLDPLTWSVARMQTRWWGCFRINSRRSGRATAIATVTFQKADHRLSLIYHYKRKWDLARIRRTFQSQCHVGTGIDTPKERFEKSDVMFSVIFVILHLHGITVSK
ncbi:UNVERIFIED_CONTAM: hypothetical protein Sradi_6168600 [Sesamum radiatum]|uniref:Copia protein n=1 Tax=Sesamum radiatum TaxID=300843 RepID=A0AAW2K7S3_SESRA